MRLTGEDIRRRALRMADETDPVASADDWTDSQELLDVVNEALAVLHGHLAEHAPDTVTRRVNLAVAAGADCTQVEDILSVREVYWLDGGTRNRSRPVDLSAVADYSATDTTSYPGHRLMGDTLHWFPRPASALTAEVWHILAPRKLESVEDEIGAELPYGWERFAVAYVAAYVLSKAETDPSPAMVSQQRALDSIVAQARGKTPAGTVRNVYRDADDLTERKRRLPRP